MLAFFSFVTLAAALDANGLEERPRWEVSAAAWTATPAVLPPGLSLGATAEAERRIATSPLFVSARLGWTAASGANVDWVVEHHQFVGALGAGVDAHVGVGRVWAQAGVGASGLHEILSRHQRQRIDAAGVPGGAESSFTLGPYGFAEVGAGVRMRGAVSLFVAGGPALSRTVVDPGVVWRFGGAARLGVAYEF